MPQPVTTLSPRILVFGLIHAKIAFAMDDKRIDLAEAAGVEQQIEPFARGQLAGLVLLVDRDPGRRLLRFSERIWFRCSILGFVINGFSRLACCLIDLRNARRTRRQR